MSKETELTNDLDDVFRWQNLITNTKGISFLLEAINHVNPTINVNIESTLVSLLNKLSAKQQYEIEKMTNIFASTQPKDVADEEFVNSQISYFKSKAAATADTKDKYSNFVWNLKAAKLGDSHAQCIVGLFYETDEMRDEKRAFEWYQKSAAQNYAFGQHCLAICYKTGFAGIAKNHKTAFELFQKAADQGSVNSYVSLAHYYGDTTIVQKDDKKAYKLYVKAYDLGSNSAMAYLGNCFMQGIGVDKDEKKGIFMLTKSAENGYHFAQAELATCYRNGTGVTKDKEKAIFWFSKAALQNNLFACRQLEQLNN